MSNEETIVDRLERYRKENFIDTKKEMAEKMGVSPREYQFVESRTENKRKPNTKFLEKLEECTGISKSYWAFGDKSEFKHTESAIKSLIKEGYIKDINFSKDVEEAILSAVKADIQYILLKKKSSPK